MEAAQVVQECTTFEHDVQGRPFDCPDMRQTHAYIAERMSLLQSVLNLDQYANMYAMFTEMHHKFMHAKHAAFVPFLGFDTARMHDYLRVRDCTMLAYYEMLAIVIEAMHRACF